MSFWFIKKGKGFSCNYVFFSNFYASSRFRNSSGYVFFKICSHIFMIFEVKLEWWLWSRRNRKWREKTSGFAAWIFFALILKKSEKTVFEQKFGFSVVVFCSHAAISLWFLLFFSVFWIGFFFWMVFPIHSQLILDLVFFWNQNYISH